jgi:hypothetical protein
MTKEEAIRILKNFSLCGMYHQLIHMNDKDSEAISMAIKALEQPEPQWIPCSERMPEYYDWYLVSNKETSWVALWQDGVFLSVSGYLEFSDIIAWMPLPEPYVERRTNEQTD